MAIEFPPIEPYDSGMLDAGDGHAAWQLSRSWLTSELESSTKATTAT
jgi:hypothetical protein